MNLNNFKEHVPDTLLLDNENLDKFLDVLNGMLSVREDELEVYAKSFYYPAVTRLQTVQRYISDYAGEYPENMSIQCLDALYNSYYDIYSRKGTEAGLLILLDRLFCLADGTTTLTSFEKGKPLILSDSARYRDFLPNGQDLANELEPTGAVSYAPTLLGDTWSDSYNYVTIGVPNVGSYTVDFLDFIRGVLLNYLPMVSVTSVVINFE